MLVARGIYKGKQGEITLGFKATLNSSPPLHHQKYIAVDKVTEDRVEKGGCCGFFWQQDHQMRCRPEMPDLEELGLMPKTLKDNKLGPKDSASNPSLSGQPQR